MRIGSYNATARYRNSINRTYEQQTKIMEMSDGDRIHRPSDDCVGYSKYLRHSITYGENAQYQTNVKTAISWMKNTDAALVDMANAFSKVVVKSNQADGANSDADMRAIAGEMLVQVQQAVADANTNVNGRYLFSGQKDLVQPYEISKEMKPRGLAKTLDDPQSNFFIGEYYDEEKGKTVNLEPTKSGDVKQMLTMYGDNGNVYYLNTKNGKVYTQEFMDEGYKEKIAKGQQYVQDGDEAGDISDWGDSLHVSDYFDAYGVCDEDRAGSTVWEITEGGKKVKLRFATVEQYIVEYKGDRKQFSMVKENGTARPTNDTVNASGVEIAGRGIFDNEDSGHDAVSGANAFNDMFTVVAMCDHGAGVWDEEEKEWVQTAKPNSNWMDSDGKTLANNAYNTVNSAQTRIASRQSVYADCQAMLSTESQTVLGDITEIHSTDVSKLAVDMMTLQTVYNLSLNVGSKVLPMSLVDYLH